MFFPSGYLAANPPTISIIEMLARSHCDVDVFTIKNLHSPIHDFNRSNIRIKYMPVTLNKARERRTSLTIVFAAWAFLICTFRKYDCVIGSGIRGLMSAALVSKVFGLPAVYNCLELYPADKYSQLLKRLERWAVRTCAFSIIQDELRARLLARDTGIQLRDIITLPNSLPGFAKRRQSNYLRTRFNIREESTILLSAGVFSRNRMLLELVQLAQTWPEDWVLVLHSAQATDQAFVNQVTEADKRKCVVFSMEPVPLKELPDLVSSADIGIALYDSDSNENTRNMGLSSGKVAQCAQCGIPFVISDLPGIGDLVKKYQCGVPIQDIKELRTAIETIILDYERMSHNAIKCFNEALSVEKYFDRVIRRIQLIHGNA